MRCWESGGRICWAEDNPVLCYRNLLKQLVSDWLVFLHHLHKERLMLLEILFELDWFWSALFFPCSILLISVVVKSQFLLAQLRDFCIWTVLKVSELLSFDSGPNQLSGTATHFAILISLKRVVSTKRDCVIQVWMELMARYLLSLARSRLCLLKALIHFVK